MGVLGEAGAHRRVDPLLLEEQVSTGERERVR